MADLQKILGSMLATGMGGRSRRGPAFAGMPSGMPGGASALFGKKGGLGGVRGAAGLAALGYLAYRAYQDYQGKAASDPHRTAPVPDAARSSGRSSTLGGRLADLLSGGGRREPAPEATLEDQQALLLIRAMIAAANADGEISAEERTRIEDRLEAAGASAEDRRFIDQELRAPRSVDALVAEVRDAETAEQVYLASRVAIEPDSAAERTYLDYLAARLRLDPERVQELNRLTER